jgi:hypothetical protein
MYKPRGWHIAGGIEQRASFLVQIGERGRWVTVECGLNVAVDGWEHMTGHRAKGSKKGRGEG